MYSQNRKHIRALKYPRKDYVKGATLFGMRHISFSDEVDAAIEPVWLPRSFLLHLSDRDLPLPLRC